MVLGAYDGGTLIDWSWVDDHTAEIRQRVIEHLQLVGWSLLWGLVLALPLALLAHRFHWLRGPALSVTGILYTIPSIAAFSLLLPYTGLAQTTAIIPLTAYTLLILVRNVLAGLDAVPGDVLEAAQGMGYSDSRRLFAVELPLAVPSIMAGLRIAAVTLIGLVPIAALVGQGGLGHVHARRLQPRLPDPAHRRDGARRDHRGDRGCAAPRWSRRLVTPWNRRVARA